MRRYKEIRSRGWVLAIFLCFGFIPTSQAQYFTADFMEPYETEALGNGL